MYVLRHPGSTLCLLADHIVARRLRLHRLGLLLVHSLRFRLALGLLRPGLLRAPGLGWLGGVNPLS